MSWEIKKLSEVCQIKPPKKEAKQKLAESDLVSFVPMSNLGIGTKKITLNEDRPLGKVVGSYTYFSEDDVLLAKITPCFENGKLGIARNLTNGIGFGSSEYVVFRSKGEIEPDYLFYFLSRDTFRNEGARVMSGAVGHKRIPKEFIEDYSLSVPPIAEQKQIVAILDEAFERIDGAIANTEKNLANARELFESYLNAIFTRKGRGWRDLTLQEISAKFSRGKSKHRPRGDQKLYGGKYPFIQTSDIGNSKHRIIDYSQTYNDFGLAQSELWPRGTVCIAIVGANIAETAILEFDACFPDSVIGIVVNSDIASSDYVEYLLQFFKSEIKAKGKGAARENINMGTFANQRFPFPDLETQKAIACQLDELSFQSERIEEVYQQKLAALNELKQSILQKAFSGELTADTAAQAANAAQEVTAA